MKLLKFLGVTTAALFASAFLIAQSSSAGQAQELEWHRIFGIPEAFNVVGSGTGAVPGGAPWTTTSGEAEVDLKDGKIKFTVKGLVLAVGGNTTAMLSGLDIGTPAGVTAVKGTLVCSVSGVGNGGNSVLVDTDAVALSAQGDAHFSGKVGSSTRSVRNQRCCLPDSYRRTRRVSQLLDRGRRRTRGRARS